LRPSEQKRLQDELAERVAKGQALIDQYEKSVPQTAAPTGKPPTRAVPPAAIPADVCNVSEPLVLEGRVLASRGKSPGGRYRKTSPWMKPLTRLMASGLSLQKAASQLGLVFSEKEERRIRSLKEFRKLRFAYLQLFETHVWGRPMEEAALQKLLIREEGRPTRTPKPHSARYVSHPRRLMA
jgi:hypothetical protein